MKKGKTFYRIDSLFFCSTIKEASITDAKSGIQMEGHLALQPTLPANGISLKICHWTRGSIHQTILLKLSKIFVTFVALHLL